MISAPVITAGRPQLDTSSLRLAIFYYGGWRIAASHEGQILGEMFCGSRRRAVQVALDAHKIFGAPLRPADFDQIEQMQLRAWGGQI